MARLLQGPVAVAAALRRAPSPSAPRIYPPSAGIECTKSTRPPARPGVDVATPSAAHHGSQSSDANPTAQAGGPEDSTDGLRRLSQTVRKAFKTGGPPEMDMSDAPSPSDIRRKMFRGVTDASAMLDSGRTMSLGEPGDTRKPFGNLERDENRTLSIGEPRRRMSL